MEWMKAPVSIVGWQGPPAAIQSPSHFAPLLASDRVCALVDFQGGLPLAGPTSKGRFRPWSCSAIQVAARPMQ